MKKRVVIIVISLIVVFLVGLLFIMHKESNTIILKNDVFTYELGANISADVSDYLKDADSTKNINEYKIVTDDFDIVDKTLVINKEGEKVGDYIINIMYKKLSKKVIIKIVDTTSPEFTTFEENIKIEKTTEEVDLMNNFEATDLSEVKITMEGEYDLTKEGNYEINVIATDSSENKTEKKSTITVYKKEVIKETSVTKQDSTSNTSSKKEETKTSTNNNTSNNTSTPQHETSSPRYRKDISDTYITQINAYRKANGLNELPVTAEAQAEADRRAKELSTYYSHDGVGYGFGEIIGNGSIGVDFIVAWKNSPSHNATMLRDHTVAMAASVYEYNNKWYTIVSFRMDY
ncbi:MAG: CAP domain-containing protein [Clostridiales bacterium]|nr:CAP domain-containing protein [Clostridiales bacterium]